MAEIFDGSGIQKVQSKVVPAILEENGLSEYITIFEQNKLNSIDVLSGLTENDYIRMGVTVLGDRKKMVKLFSGNAGSSGAQSSGSQIGQQIIIQTGSSLPTKSLAAGILLPLFFGPFGMFYAGVGMGILGLALYGITLVISLVTLGIGALLFIPLGFLAIIITAVSVSNYNKRLLTQNNANKTANP
jgi:hypothetical protein